MLETLADNRDLQPQLDEAKQMLSQVNVKKFASYNWGLRDGLLQGERSKARNMALRLLKHGSLKPKEIAEIAELSLEEVKQLQQEIEQ